VLEQKKTDATHYSQPGKIYFKNKKNGDRGESIKNPSLLTFGLIFITTVFVYSFILLPFPTEWDHFFYIWNIKYLKPSHLIAGRLLFISIQAFFLKILSPLNIEPYKIFCVVNTSAGLMALWYFLKFLDREIKPLFFYLLILGLCVFEESYLLSLATLYPDALMIMFGMASLCSYETYSKTNQNKYLILFIVLLILAVFCREYVIYFASYPILRLSSKWGRFKTYLFIFLIILAITACSYIAFEHFRILFKGFFTYIKYSPGLLFYGLLPNIKSLTLFSSEELSIVVLGIFFTLFYPQYRKKISFEKIIFLTAPCLVLLFTFVESRMDLRYFIWVTFSLNYLYAQAVVSLSEHPIWCMRKFIRFKRYFILLSFAPVLVNGVIFYSTYSDFWRHSNYKKRYFYNLKNVITERTLLIPGSNTPLVDLYIREVKKGQLVWENWAWTNEKFFEETVLNSLKEGKRVFVDIRSINVKNERADLRRPGWKFKYIKHDEFFHEIVKK
jgi:hypothetical protein